MNGLYCFRHNPSASTILGGSLDATALRRRYASSAPTATTEPDRLTRSAGAHATAHAGSGKNAEGLPHPKEWMEQQPIKSGRAQD